MDCHNVENLQLLKRPLGLSSSIASHEPFHKAEFSAQTPFPIQNSRNGICGKNTIAI
jgi:hypothetical protein